FVWETAVTMTTVSPTWTVTAPSASLPILPVSIVISCVPTWHVIFSILICFLFGVKIRGSVPRAVAPDPGRPDGFRPDEGGVGGRLFCGGRSRPMSRILPKQRKRREHRRFHGKGLAAQAEGCEHLLISLRIGAGKVIEEFAATGDEAQQAAT